MTGPCFVDANVFVYAGDPRDPAKHQRARAWRDHLWRTQSGRTSMQVLSETYSALKRIGAGTPAAIWDSVQLLFAWDPMPIDGSVLRRARDLEQRFRLSWWDSLIVAAAQLQNCEILLTEDLHDGAAFGTLVVRNPFSLKIEQPLAAYEARPVLAGLHRPRGRPRRSAFA